MAEKYLTSDPSLAIDRTVEELNPASTVIVTDENVKKYVFPTLVKSEVVKNAPLITIPPGEEGKTLETVVKIWELLETTGATRKSVVVNIGGGVVTDIGGFAAATFKRGVRVINFPTTLLGAVDAATGGKTGINFKGLKNEIGAFHKPSKVIISPLPFTTLSSKELMSGYAEMVKTAMISDQNFYLELYNIEEVLSKQEKLGEAVEKCVRIKEEIVAQDPTETGLRKVLNFGHTAGHAFESFRIERQQEVTHGEAVAHGMLVALILSHLKLGFPSMELNYYKNFLKENFPGLMIGCKDIPTVIDIMAHDKKNPRPGEVSFTLLQQVGNPVIECNTSSSELQQALEIYIEMLD